MESIYRQIYSWKQRKSSLLLLGRRIEINEVSIHQNRRIDSFLNYCINIML